MIHHTDITLSPREAADPSAIRRAAARKLGLKPTQVNALRELRRSVDARKRPVKVNLRVEVASGSDREFAAVTPVAPYLPVGDDALRVVIVGAGPAGLFAALAAIRAGWRPIVLERGRDVDARRLDLARISRNKQIDPVSNYCFGEGGAGAYSDGKLYTRSKKRGSNREVLEILVAHGASPDILVDAHPHIGSDRLPGIIRAIRQTIMRCGGEVHFETRADDLILESGRVTGVKSGTTEYKGRGVIMATGHSARDTMRMAFSRGVALEAKGLAVGVRLEHPQDLVDRIQYHSPEGRGEYLPPAEYAFVTQADGRGVYSFCMCPGGVIVPAGSETGELVVNGMSASARAGAKANSGMVVEVHPGDIDGYAHHGPLEMLCIQEDLERSFYREAGDSIVAPAQRMVDFTEGKISEDLPSTSYAPGIQTGDFNRLLPPFIATRLRQGFLDFGRKSPGFLTNEAALVGLESRTSSPVRMTRGSDSLESVSTPGLYPAGEGAGYAGGIVSAAVDGMRAMQALAASIERADQSDDINRQ